MSSIALQATRKTTNITLVGVDSVLLGVFISLLLLGLVMVFSSTIAMGDKDLYTTTSYLWKQVMHIFLGLGITIVIAFIPLWVWQKLSIPMLVITFFVLALVLLAGTEVNASRRWLSIMGLRIQPVEFAKLAVIIYVASYLTRRRLQLEQFSKGILNIALVLILFAVLLLLQPDYGSLFVITATIGLMLFLGGIKVSHTLVCLVLTTAAMTSLVTLAEYRVKRLMSFTDPWQTPFGDGFQLVQALIAIGRGEIFGVGLGGSIQKLYYLPHAHNDFILAVIGEELGLVGIIFVIVLFVMLFQRCLVIARNAELVGKIFAARLAQGVGLLLVLQAVINIGVNLGVLPTKGLTLPFVSYGGSSLLICCAAIGLVFAVDRQTSQRGDV